MSAHSYFRGHLILFDQNKQYWVYADTKNRCGLGFEIRPCKKCGKVFGFNEPDPCLGELSGVINACCGHGIPKMAYINFD